MLSKASFTAEEAARNGVDFDELTSERIQQLEILVTEYKGAVQELQRELDESSKDGMEQSKVGQQHYTDSKKS